MKKLIFSVLLLAALLLGATGPAYAAGPVEYTIDLRNHTGQPVEFNYTGADGITHTKTVEAGVTKFDIFEGTYSYWADPSCGHISGTINISQQRQVLWITCDSGEANVVVTKTMPGTGVPSMLHASCDGVAAFAYKVFDWDYEWDSATAWLPYGYFCFDTPPTEGDTYPASVWFNGENYDYEYHQLGIECQGWVNPGEGFYYYDSDYGWCPGNNP